MVSNPSQASQVTKPNIIPCTTPEQINIQNNGSSDNNHQGTPLAAWLQDRNMRYSAQQNGGGTHSVVADDATLKNWLVIARQQPPSAPQQGLEEGDLQERLRVAIATTKALSNIHEGNNGVGARYCGAQHLSLENIMLDISDSYCDATLNIISGDGTNIIPSSSGDEETSTKEADMNLLGYILNAVFGGDSFSTRMKEVGEKKTEGEDDNGRQTKKRGKSQQQSVENLPLYLTCLISSLITTYPGGGGGGTTGVVQYQSVKHVLQDLQLAAKKPQVYLKKNSWDDVKNRRLQIPHDAFYGRKSELSLVLHSLDTVLKFGQPVLVSVQGYAGTGKTTLLNQVKKPLTASGGFMIRCKFDKTRSPITVIFSALDIFFGEINRAAADLQAELKQSIPECAGCGLGVLLSAIPNLRTLVETKEEDQGDETDAEFDEFDIEETTVSHQRWKFLLCKLIHAISNQSHPIALHLDDLHWCDVATLDMIQTLVMDPDIRYCLFLGSYRNNADADELGVAKTLDSIQRAGVRLSSLKLSSIEKESVNSLISEILCIPPFLSQPLSTVVCNKTGGLILFAVDFLKSLHEEGMIRFNLTSQKWQYNVNDIRQRKVPTDVVQHLSERIMRLPINIQSLLKIAACLGFEFDAELLGMAIKGNMELLPYAIDSGFLQEIPSCYAHPTIAWAHDQIHLAAYELIPLNKRQSSHLLIGSRIYMNTSSEAILHKVIFDIVNNMNQGLELITSQEQRNEVSQLNLTAGRKAMASSSFSSAAEYFMIGVNLLANDCWECNYRPSMILHQAASEALFVAADFDVMKKIIDEQLCHANCLEDKLPAYYSLLRLLHASSNVKEAVKKSLSILGELGETFTSPSEVTPELVYEEIVSTQAQINHLTMEDILTAPRLADERRIWTFRFMNCLLTYLYHTRPVAMPLVACRVVTLSSLHGYCPDSAMGFASYSFAIQNVLHDIDLAYRWAKISLCFPEMFNAQAMAPKLICYFHIFTSFWKEPLQATCDALRKSQQDLLMLGDVDVATHAMFGYCRQSLFSGKELGELNKECVSVTTKMAKLGQIQACLSHSSNHLVILTLMGDTMTNPFLDICNEAFNGEVKNEDDLLQHAVSTGKVGIVQAIQFNRCFLAYWFKRYEEAAEMAKLYKKRSMMPLVDAYHTFLEGLTAYHFARQCSNDPKWLEIGENALSSYKIWAKHSTWNWENKYLLLQAECHFSEREWEKAAEKYRLAIESARKHRFVHEEGLANELCSAFHSAYGNVDEAKKYTADARVCYTKWGAHALVDLLDSSGTE